MDSHRRSLVKAFSYRFVAFVVTVLVAYTITGKTQAAVEIGVADSLVKIFVYYGHERAWSLIPFGKPKPMEFEI